jgi:hypothetical protein
MSSSETRTPVTTVTELNSVSGGTGVGSALPASNEQGVGLNLQPEFRNILLEANDLVSGERTEQHGHPGPNLDRIAAMWSAAFEWDVTGEDVALAMILFKVSRAIAGKTRDNLVDIAGYARTIEMVWESTTNQKPE